MDLSPILSMNSQDMFLGAMNTKSSTETMKAEILLVFMYSLPHIYIVRSIGHIGNPGLTEPEERRTLSYQPKPDD